MGARHGKMPRTQGPSPSHTLTCAWTIRSFGASQHLSAWPERSVQGGHGAQLGACRSVNKSYYKLPSRKTFSDANSGKNHSALHSVRHLHGLDPTLGLSCSPSPLPSVCRGVPYFCCPNHRQGRQRLAGVGEKQAGWEMYSNPSISQRLPSESGGRDLSASECSSLGCVLLPPAEVSASRGQELILAASSS